MTLSADLIVTHLDNRDTRLIDSRSGGRESPLFAVLPFMFEREL
ncbi:hypothetical protein [Pseudomonas japonica]|uniref:Uncharacterized protein n=1 Tax=Pseudomonas japonica TaxID=256466 RepID=A0A239EZB5_9PSED|nr:hypothetical protein [Pseudomonas japonica]SNS49628.1 hypothetical protein SAMN05444352_10925 [Pseudomonas japonica]